MALHKDIIERANARIGSVLKGKWRLDAVIGIGGMASVYAATHRNQARAAIKLLHAEVAMDAEVNARFLREGYVANAVGHPGTVTVLDDDMTEDGAPFLVMELLIGQTLDTMLAMEPDGIALHEVLMVLDQLLEVLAAAHDKGIVHRDLKPENLFLTTEGKLKVLDFGIARLRELTTQAPTSSTRAGSVLGTPAFMAPEQALGRWDEVDGRTDIWAVGATAFTLLSGQFVHEASTLQEQLVYSATRAARPLREVAPQVGAELALVIDQALAFDRGVRFASARAMRQALRQASGMVSLPPSTPVSPRLLDEARVSSPADQHGATLVAPLDVTSAITGRGDTATGHPVTRSTVVSGPPRRRLWPIAVALFGLGMLGAGALLFVTRHSGGAVVPPGGSVSTHSATPAPDAPAPLPSAHPVADPAVAPVVDSTHTPATPSAAPLKGHGNAPAAANPPPTLPTLPKLPPIKTPATSSKSLMGGDENPFDRRH